MKLSIAIALSISHAVLGLTVGGQLPYLINPLPQVTVGSEMLSILLPNNYNQTCEVTVAFSNVDFLPLQLFATPYNCSGQQLANITLPNSVPDGLASLTVICAGSNSISRTDVNIYGGCSDLDAFADDLRNSSTMVSISCIKSATSAASAVPIPSKNWTMSNTLPTLPTTAQTSVTSATGATSTTQPLLLTNTLPVLPISSSSGAVETATTTFYVTTMVTLTAAGDSTSTAKTATSASFAISVINPTGTD